MDDSAIEADIGTPAIFLLSSESDPTPLVEEAGKEGKLNFNSVSIGQGREEFMEAYISQATAKEELFLLPIAISIVAIWMFHLIYIKQMPVEQGNSKM
jgi:hypothetical protein